MIYFLLIGGVLRKSDGHKIFVKFRELQLDFLFASNFATFKTVKKFSFLSSLKLFQKFVGHIWLTKASVTTRI